MTWSLSPRSTRPLTPIPVRFLPPWRATCQRHSRPTRWESTEKPSPDRPSPVRRRWSSVSKTAVILWTICAGGRAKRRTMCRRFIGFPLALPSPTKTGRNVYSRHAHTLAPTVGIGVPTRRSHLDARFGAGRGGATHTGLPARNSARRRRVLHPTKTARAPASSSPRRAT